MRDMDLDHIFMHHKPTPEQIDKYARIRGAAKDFAKVVLDKS